MSWRLERAARRAGRAHGLPRDERLRATEEFRHHLEGTAAEYRALGYGRRKADRLALRDFGDVRKTRTDLGRAWRGQRTVLFPQAAADHVASFVIYDLKPILVILCLVLLLRWQVVAAYHIPTKSMEPTLHGDPDDGDKILVNKLYYHLYSPERWQVAVFEKEGEDRNLIKRIAGLPGELVDIRGGDLYIDRAVARKPRQVQEDLLVPVFKDNRDLIVELEGDSAVGLDAWDRTGEWTEAQGRFLCSAGEDGLGRLSYPRPVRDEYPGGLRRYDGEDVGDLVLRLRVTPGEQTVAVGAVLREGTNCFDVRIPVGYAGDTVLLHGGEQVASVEGLHLTAGAESSIRFSNVDDLVTLDVEGVTVLSYEVPDPCPAEEIDEPVAEFGFRGGSTVFRDVTLLRDIYYRSDPSLPVEIPDDSYFMLGDNSGNSMDSRSWGPVPESGLIGRPVFVIWPPSRLKLVR